MNRTPDSPDPPPHHGEERAALIGRAVDEFLAREAEGDVIDLRTFLAGLPDIAAEVREQIELVRAVDSLVDADLEISRRTLGDFQILREVGRGGMGVVYEAEQISLGRRVALKVLSTAAVLDQRQVERFKNEARAAARLHHSGIVPVYAVGSEDGVHYYAMQYIDGQSLQQIIGGLRRDAAQPATRSDSHTRSAPTVGSLRTPAGGGQGRQDRRDGSSGGDSALSSASVPEFFRRAARLALQAAEALEYAHQLGIVHRDIKPGNLLLDSRGKLWVADFGLAQINREASLTMTGEVLGTLRYMSPEQAAGKHLALDQRSDVYSLGVTLYELITLRTPFPGSNRADLVQRIHREMPPRPRSIEPEIPVDLETIVVKSIEKEPDHRYASMADLAADLRSFVEDRPILARRTAVYERLWRWCRRNPVVAGLSAFSSLLAAGIVVALLVLATIDRARERAEFAETRTGMYSALARARFLRAGSGPGRRSEAIAVLRDAARKLDAIPLPDAEREALALQLRDELLACASRLDAEVARTWSWEAPLERVEFMAISPDFEHYALEYYSGDVPVHRISDGQRVALLPARTRVPVVARFSPTGRYLVVNYTVSAAGALTTVWDWRKEKPVLAPEALHSYRAMSCWGPGDRFLFALANAGQASSRLIRYDVETGESQRLLSVPEGATHLSVSPDGRQVAIAHRAHIHGFAVSGDTGSWVLEIESSGGVVWGSSWSPDGKRLACATSAGKVHIVDTETRDIIAVATGHQGDVRAVTFHPGGQLLATAAVDGTCRIFDAFNGEERLRLDGIVLEVVHFSRDGSLLGSSSRLQEGSFWRVRQPRIHTSLRYVARARDPFVHAAVAPDGRLAATSHVDGVRLWDLRLERSAARLEIGPVRSVAFDPTTGSLFTGGETVLRWPVARTDSTVQIGPPEALEFSVEGLKSLRLDREGARVCVFTHRGNLQCLELPGERFLSADDSSVVDAVLPDSEHIAYVDVRAGPVSQNTVLRILDLVSGELVLERPGISARLAVSGDGRWLGASSVGDILVFDMRDPRKRPWRIEKGVESPMHRAIAFSPDGELLAAVHSGGQLRLYRVRSRETVATLLGPDSGHILDLVFGPRGRYLLAPCTNSSIRVWKLEEIAEFLAENELPGIWSSHRPAPVPVGDLAVEILWGIESEVSLELPRDPATPATLERYERTLAANPENPSIHHQLGILRARLGQLQAARESLDRAIALAPAARRAHRDRAALLEQLGDPVAALADYRAFLDASGEVSPPERERLASLEFRAGEVRAAIRTLEALAVREPPDDATRSRLEEYRTALLPRLASCESVDAFLGGPEGSGRRARLLREFEEAARGEDRAVLEYLRGRHQLEQGELEPAIQSLERSVDEDPAAALPVVRLLNALIRADRWPAVERRAREALEIQGRTTRSPDIWHAWSAAVFGPLAWTEERIRDRLPRLPRGDDRPRRNLLWLLDGLGGEGILRINSGPDDWPEPGGPLWSACRYEGNGRHARVPGVDVQGTDRDQLFETAHLFEAGKESVAYHIPLVAGTYVVTLHFAEVFAPPDGARPGSRSRVFDVLVGDEVLVTRYSPPPLKADSRSVRVDHRGGFLDIRVRSLRGEPAIWALEIERGSHR